MPYHTGKGSHSKGMKKSKMSKMSKPKKKKKKKRQWSRQRLLKILLKT